MKNALIAATAVAAVAGGAWFLTRPAVPSDTVVGAAMAQDADVDTSQVTEMVKGDEDAPVDVIEYASFTCPHCASFHENQWPQIEENYVETGKVRFVYREVYFDRPGLWASMVARCGGEDRFFGITDLIYERQQGWARQDSGEAIISDLRRIGKVAGLTDEDLDSCLSDGETAQTLYGWFQANAEADDVQGTPSFVIAGEKYSNMSYDDFAAVLDEKLAEADAAE